MADSAPNLIDIAGLLASAALLAGAAGVAAARRRGAALACGWIGVALGVFVLSWHSMAIGAWLPLEDNFDALGALGIMLAGCVLYIQGTRPVGGLDFFVLPLAALMLVAAAVFGKVMPHVYAETAWSLTHRLTAYGGAMALAVAGAVGAMYLVASRRFRSKQFSGATTFGNLERLESIAYHALVIGWPLFTVGLITGLLWGIHLTSRGVDQQHLFFGPKILLALGVWVVYALALHTPINPSFRGRKAAVLSLIGLFLMALTIVAVQFMPGGKH